MFELGHVQHVVRMIPLRINNAVRDNTILYDSHPCFAFRVGDYLRINPATTL